MRKVIVWKFIVSALTVLLFAYPSRSFAVIETDSARAACWTFLFQFRDTPSTSWSKVQEMAANIGVKAEDSKTDIRFKSSDPKEECGFFKSKSGNDNIGFFFVESQTIPLPVLTALIEKSEIIEADPGGTLVLRLYEMTYADSKMSVRESATITVNVNGYLSYTRFQLQRSSKDN